MAKNTFTSWQQLTPMGVQTGGVPGNASNTFPINSGPEPWFRDRLDAVRSGRLPSAGYPDGYLGTVRTRREDRLVQHGGTRQTQRSYERGIHVGARVSPDAYFWTNEVNPQLGLRLQAAGAKFAPQGEALTHLVNGGKPGPVRGTGSLDDPRLRPRARSG
jgi:hypothetical protein